MYYMVCKDVFFYDLMSSIGGFWISEKRIKIIKKAILIKMKIFILLCS